MELLAALVLLGSLAVTTGVFTRRMVGLQEMRAARDDARIAIGRIESALMVDLFGDDARLPTNGAVEGTVWISDGDLLLLTRDRGAAEVRYHLADGALMRSVRGLGGRGLGGGVGGGGTTRVSAVALGVEAVRWALERDADRRVIAVRGWFDVRGTRRVVRVEMIGRAR